MTCYTIAMRSKACSSVPVNLEVGNCSNERLLLNFSINLHCTCNQRRGAIATIGAEDAKRR